MKKREENKQEKWPQPPIGRWPSYAEDVNDVRSAYNRIKAFQQYDEELIRFRLAGKFLKPVEIIDEYCCYGEFLDELTLAVLAKSQVGKRFFELAQKVKRNLIKTYRHDEITDEEITIKISKATLQMLSEYNESGKINTKNWERFIEQDADSENKLKISSPSRHRKATVRVFKYWYGTKIMCSGPSQKQEAA